MSLDNSTLNWECINTKIVQNDMEIVHVEFSDDLETPVFYLYNLAERLWKLVPCILNFLEATSTTAMYAKLEAEFNFINAWALSSTWYLALVMFHFLS